MDIILTAAIPTLIIRGLITGQYFILARDIMGIVGIASITRVTVTGGIEETRRC